MPTGVVYLRYVGDARLKTHYPHGKMHVVAPHLRNGSAVQRLVFVVPSPVRSTRPKVLSSVIMKTRSD